MAALAAAAQRRALPRAIVALRRFAGASRHAVLAVVVALPGCAAQMSPPAAPVGDSAQARWDAYLALYEAVELQDGCVPRRVDPPPAVAVRGAVMLMHGYFSCPQQFETLLMPLNEAGFRVYLPVLPGHGVKALEPDADDVSELAVPRDWARVFPDFVDRMNGVMALEEGERVLGGLSVGASLAVLANARREDLYDRTLLWVPFFGVPGGGFSNTMAATLSRTPLLREINMSRLGWRPSCLEKRRQGRAGLCNYRAKHLGAIVALGAWNLEQIETRPIDGPLQVLAIDDDPSVSEARVRRFAAAHAGRPGASGCLLDADLPHSLLSHPDNPGVDMYWLPWLVQASAAFLVEGEPVPQQDAAEGELPACAVAYERRSAAAPR